MAISFSALVAAYFAVCIWIGVRVINRRETWAKRTLIAVAGLPLLYVASFGPACWLCEKGVLGQRTAWTIFRPVIWYCMNGSERVQTCLRGYAQLCGDRCRLREVFTFIDPVDSPKEKRGLGGLMVLRALHLEVWVRRENDSVSPIDFEAEHADRLKHLAAGTPVEPPGEDACKRMAR